MRGLSRVTRLPPISSDARHSLAHVFYVPRFVAHAKTLKPECVCDEPEPLPETATREEIEDFEIKNEQECLKKCPPVDSCTVERTLGMTLE